MRILHISEGGLPDPRVERMALTMKNEGHELSFIGGETIKGQYLGAFSKASTVPLGNSLQIVYDPRVKKNWLKAIEEARPDVVHANNVIVGHFLLDSELPTIFDDHEVLSNQPFMYASRPFIRRMAAKVLWRQLPKWEKDMALRFPIITISEGLANYYRQYSSNVEVVVNTPSLKEVEWLENVPQRKGLVYIGGDFSLKKFNPYRDMSGLRDLLEFDIISGFPHDEMMKRLTHYRIGLTPFKPHPFQVLCNSNKNYEYLHAGLQVVLQRNFSHTFIDDPYVHPFLDYTDIVDVINAVPEMDPEEIMKHARNRYVWENQEQIILNAYKRI
jgi:hypothetical protein